MTARTYAQIHRPNGRSTSTDDLTPEEKQARREAYGAKGTNGYVHAVRKPSKRLRRPKVIRDTRELLDAALERAKAQR
jgi:hypothetical protein